MVVGSGFFLARKNFEKMFDNLFPNCAFFFKVKMSSCTLIPLFRPVSVHSGSASWDDCGRMFSDKLCVSLFPDRFPYYACTVAYSAHSNFIGSRVFACLGITCHLHFWQNDRGLLRATVVTRGWNGHRIRDSTVSSGEENSPAAPAAIRSRNLSITSPALYQQAIPGPLTSSLVADWAQSTN